MRTITIVSAALCLALATSASGEEKKVPDRHIPVEVLAGVRLLEHDFSRALARDCAPERCFSKGCMHVTHTVVDRAASGSLPGLRLDQPDPGDAPSQMYLTTVRCSFAHEPSIRGRDARTLATRLEAQVSRGWTRVEVVHERLPALPAFLRESPEPPEPPEEKPIPIEEGDEDEEEVEAAVVVPPPAPEVWEAPVAMRELWNGLLPHFSWMIGLVLLTLASLLVIWGVRRLGRQSPEDQMLMAQMLRGADDEADTRGASTSSLPGTSSEAEPPRDGAEPAASVAKQLAAWRDRLETTEQEEADPALQALVSDLLRTGERGLLAKAVMLFPDELPKAFPKEGKLASEKFELAEFLKRTDPATLPSDEVFFDKLNRYALSSSLTAQPDTDLIRGLHDDFGAVALADVLGAVPARYGALLFALSPEEMQHEATGLLTPAQMADTADQLMQSNRMDPAETRYLLEVLSALRDSTPLPAMPEPRTVSDRGQEFGAAAALSVLLPRLSPEDRARIVQTTSHRAGGRLPGWLEGTLYGEMLLALDGETRTNLLLEVDVGQLAAWLQVQTERARAAILQRAPDALRAAITGRPAPGSTDELHALANEGRTALSEGIRRRLLGGTIAFTELLV
jgi:hypothetical protein